MSSTFENNARVVTLSSENRTEFIQALRLELYKKFQVDRDELLPENYANSKPWSLLKMLEEGRLDLYQMIYVNDRFWGSSGGIVRELDDGSRIYQAGFRTLSRSHENGFKGFGTKPYITGLSIRTQIERAKQLGCKKIVLSFNESNKRLFDVVNNYLHKKSFLGVNELTQQFVPSSEPILFNGVPQWLLQMTLR